MSRRPRQPQQVSQPRASYGWLLLALAGATATGIAIWMHRRPKAPARVVDGRPPEGQAAGSRPSKPEFSVMDTLNHPAEHITGKSWKDKLARGLVSSPLYVSPEQFMERAPKLLKFM